MSEAPVIGELWVSRIICKLRLLVASANFGSGYWFPQALSVRHRWRPERHRPADW